MKMLLPPSIPDDDLIAKCSPRGAGLGGGDIVWSGCYALGYIHINGHGPAIPRPKRPAMAYKMEHWTSTRAHYRTIDDIVVTNLFCAKGWDIIVCGSIVQHEDRKTTAQGEAEKLLTGAM